MKTTLVVAAVCIAASFHSDNTFAQAPPGQPQHAAPTAPLLSPDQLEALVGRIALYPDDLLGLVLPAATTPLDVAKGQRFLEKYKQDKTLKPDPSLSPPVLSLLAYPEIVNFMYDDLDWTEALGHAVIAQQPDVLQAIQVFRRKAQDAGNLKTDDKQVVVEQQDAVKIVPAKQEVVYVPQYQPSAAVVQQTAPPVTYSSTAYPSYYQPGAAAAAATTGYWAGAATAYGTNWGTGAVYSAPYASQSAYNQQQRQNYSSSAQTQRQDATSQNQSQRQQTSTTNQAQRQQSASGAQSQSSANQAQRQSAAGAQQGQHQAPEGAQHWQGGGGGAGFGGGQGAAGRSASAGQFGGGGAGGAGRFGSAGGAGAGHEGGAFGGMSSGGRSQSFSQRGGQSMSSMSHGGGGGGRRR